MRKAIPFILILFGLGLFFYPMAGNWVNARRHVEILIEHEQAIAALDPEYIEYHFNLAREYNDSLTGLDVTDPFVQGSGAVLPPTGYMRIININGVMGRVEIPKISVNIPIFHTTDYDVLNRGVGHIEGTSFPIGGKGTHAVLTGHSGLPHSRLFTDLEEIIYGDLFFVHILGEVFAYEVDDIREVLPHEVESLRIDPEKDYVTLITCTPYGINSHRLLVRGIRIEYVPGMIEEIEPIEINLINWHAVVAILFIPVYFRLIGAMMSRKEKNAVIIDLYKKEKE